MNKIFLFGRLTRDPEVKTTSSGKTVAKMTVACERDFTGRDGKKETDFFTVIAWDKLAEIAGKYLEKGRQAVVFGSIQMRQYETSSGEKRTAVEVTAQTIKFTDGKGKEKPQAHQADEPAGRSFDDDEINLEDDSPF
jgi:single-strand DNA-binding protein